jgi:hypothetical protein
MIELCFAPHDTRTCVCVYYLHSSVQCVYVELSNLLLFGRAGPALRNATFVHQTKLSSKLKEQMRPSMPSEPIKQTTAVSQPLCH